MDNFRTIDGSDNNPNDLGETGASLRRLLDPAYESDGIIDDLPRGITESEPGNPFIGPSDLPNPREISNEVSAQTESVTNYLDASDWIWQWGQFLDHDLSLTDIGKTETFNISIPQGDRFFDPFNTGNASMGFHRSSSFSVDSNGIRQQHNDILFIEGNR